jgi:hypothetical protein
VAWSVAFRDLPEPHFADAAFAVLPEGATTDPAAWATTLFDRRTVPAWVAAAMAVRQLLVPLLGIRPASGSPFEVREVTGQEALLGFDDRHLDFRVGVAVDPADRLVRVVTTVRLKGWRGRLYFAPVQVVHPVVVQSMLRRARTRLTPPGSPRCRQVVGSSFSRRRRPRARWARSGS